MAFCYHCGQSVSKEMRFCPACGNQLADSASSLSKNVTVNSSSDTTIGEYRLILMSRGSCTLSDGIAILEDILGYNAVDARAFLQAAPAEIAQNLTMEQAQYIAQALTEYGMQISITNASGDYFSQQNQAASSVFDENGNLIPKVLGVIALLGVANRVAGIHRWRHEGPPPPVFRLGFYQPRPPIPFRRSPVHRPSMFSPMHPGRPMPQPRPSRPMGGMGRPGGGRGPGGPGSGRGGFGGRR